MTFLTVDGNLKPNAGLIKDTRISVADYISGLSGLKAKVLTVSQDVCGMDDVIRSIQGSTQTQERKIASLDAIGRNNEESVSGAIRIDSGVADIVKQRKEDFYRNYSYLKPECEKNDWDKLKDGLKKTGEWCREHWKLLATVALVIIAVAIIVFCPALAGGLLLAIAKGILAGAVAGGVIGGTLSVLGGGSFWEGFEDGAFMGAVAGAISGGMGFAFTGGVKGVALTLKQTLTVGGVTGAGSSLFSDLGDILIRGEDISAGRVIGNMAVSGVAGVVFAGIGYGISKGIRYLGNKAIRWLGNKGGTGTGTVWDNIKATQDNYPNTNIPKSFEVEVNGQKMWVHGNATEHIYEDIYAKIMAGEGTAYTNPNLYAQELISDFYGSLEQATFSGIRYGEIIPAGNWEFIFAPPRQEGLLPVIKHAQFNGW